MRKVENLIPAAALAIGLTATGAGFAVTAFEAKDTYSSGQQFISEALSVENNSQNLNKKEQNLLNNGEILVFAALGTAASGAISVASYSTLKRNQFYS